MKRISKILSVLMVVAMLFSLVIVPASAGDKYEFTYTFKDSTGSNVITNAKKGDMVRLYVSVNFAEKVNSFVNTFMYDTTALTLYRNNGTAEFTSFSGSAAGTIKKVGEFANSSSNDIYEASDEFIEEDETHGGFAEYYSWGKTQSAQYNADYKVSSWDDAKNAQYNAFRIVYALSEETNTLLIDTKGEAVEFLYMYFKVKEDTTLDSTTVGIDESIPENYNYATHPEEQGYNFTYSTLAENDTILTTYADVVSATLNFGTVESPVYHVKNQIQWNNKEAQSVNLGIVAGFDVEDIAINFGDDDVADNVSAIGAKYYLNGVLQDDLITTRVYKANGGTSYYFRIVLGNISTTTQDTYKVVPYVVYNGTPVDGPEIEIKPADVARYVTVLPQ